MRYGTYSFISLTLDHLCEWLKEHNDVVIVTDIKENCVEGVKLISEKYPELKDNFCIQNHDKKLLELDIPLFVHTVNEQEVLFNKGIKSIYTDF